jgi:hypothetical protein
MSFEILQRRFSSSPKHPDWLWGLFPRVKMAEA